MVLPKKKLEKDAATKWEGEKKHWVLAYLQRKEKGIERNKGARRVNKKEFKTEMMKGMSKETWEMEK